MRKNNIFSQHLFFTRADIYFWLLFILLNGFLFLPDLLFTAPKTRYSLNIEILIAFIIWIIFSTRCGEKARRLFWGIFLAFIYIALIYKSYASILIGFYQMEPNFYNDLPFIANGLPFLLDSLKLPMWIYYGFILSVVLLFRLLWVFTRAVFIKSTSQIGLATRIIFTVLGMGILLYSGIILQTHKEIPTGANSLVNEIKLNASASRKSYQNIDSFIAQNPFTTYDYAQYHLQEKPNVYIIFFESYGSVLYKREHFRNNYLEMASAFDEEISAEGWQSMSAFSEAPTWGGGSWMAYTSVLFGINVNEQSEFLALRKAYERVPYPNMGRYFQTQGYEFVWVVPINRELSPKYDAANRAFYGADRWVIYETLDYAGPLYGWGPSPPDQFTFGFIQDLVQEQEKATFLFFLNQDSHYPWSPLPPHVDDWHTLAASNDESGKIGIEENSAVSLFTARKNYLSGIRLSLENIGDFITNLEDPNAVIILIGDHQPPTVSNKDDGFETMLHIISQDTEFLANFKEFGFENGILLNTEKVALAHEGFYSLFMHNFLARYGDDAENLPLYLEDGLTD